jgi:hypothetical protein
VADWGEDEEIFDWNTVTGGQADGKCESLHFFPRVSAGFACGTPCSLGQFRNLVAQMVERALDSRAVLRAVWGSLEICFLAKCMMS